MIADHHHPQEDSSTRNMQNSYLKMCWGRLMALQDERTKTTSDYKVDLVHHIERLAVTGFTELHTKYRQKSSPKSLLEEKKKSYHNLFIIKMGQGDAAAKFCENVLNDIVLKNMDEKLSCTELLHDLRVHCGEMFRNIKSIQASIMLDLYQENHFTHYEQYISSLPNVCQK